MDQLENKKTSRYLYYGQRKQINEFYLRLDVLRRKILIVADTKFRAYLIFRICQENNKFKIKWIPSIQYNYSQILNSHDVFVTTAQTCLQLFTDENFSISDFKTIIMDDVSDLKSESSLFKYIFCPTKSLYIGLTSNLKEHVLSTIAQHFDQARESKDSQIHYNIIPVPIEDKFKKCLIDLMQEWQHMTSKFLGHIPYNQYDYGSGEMNDMLHRLVEFSSKEGVKTLHYASLKLLQIHQAVIMSQQESAIGVIDYLDSEIEMDPTVGQDYVNLENRSDLIFSLETTKEEFKEAYVTWKGKMMISKSEKPVQFDVLTKLITDEPENRILIITTSAKTAKLLSAAWDTPVQVIDPESLKDSQKLFQDIQNGVFNVSITTRPHFENILKNIYRKSLTFDLFIHYDGVLDPDFATKSVYFENQTVRPMVTPPLESKLKLYGRILAETLVELKDQNQGKNTNLVFESTRPIQQNLIQTVEPPPVKAFMDVLDVRSDIGKNLYESVENPVMLANNLIMKYFKQPPRYEESFVPSKNSYFCRIYVPGQTLVTEAWAPKKKAAKESAAELMVRKVQLMHL